MATVVGRPVQRPHGIRTRQRILDAAIDCLVELGYANTSTLAVQARAGVSRGSLLHHFRSRDELLVAAVDHLADVRLAAARDRVAQTPDSQDRTDAAVEALWDTFHGPLWLAALELWIGARTHPELRAVLLPLEREIGRKNHAAFHEIFGPPANAHPRFVEMMNMLISSMGGVALTFTFDRSGAGRQTAQLRAWKRLAHEMLESRAP